MQHRIVEHRSGHRAGAVLGGFFAYRTEAQRHHRASELRGARLEARTLLWRLGMIRIPRSTAVAFTLRELGYANVHVRIGGELGRQALGLVRFVPMVEGR